MHVLGVGDVSLTFLHSEDIVELIVVSDHMHVICVETTSLKQVHFTTTRRHVVGGEESVLQKMKL